MSWIVRWWCLSMALLSVGSVLAVGTSLLGSSEDFEHVSGLDLRNTGPDCLGKTSMVCCPRGEGWKSILSGETKSFQARTCRGPVSSVATFSTYSLSLATIGLTCTCTYLMVVVSCVVSRQFISSRVPSSNSRVASWAALSSSSIGGSGSCSLRCFSSYMSRTRQSVCRSDTSCHPLTSANFLGCKAKASEEHHSCTLGTSPCSSFSGCNSIPTGEARHTVGWSGDVVCCDVHRNCSQGSVWWNHADVWWWGWGNWRRVNVFWIVLHQNIRG